MQATVEKLDRWREQFDEAAGRRHTVGLSRSGRNWKYSTSNIVSAIRVAKGSKGGASKLVDVLQHAISMIAPPAFVGVLQNQKERSSPSASTVRRNELALDLGIVELRRREYRSDVVRYFWSDSTDQKGCKWLWAQCHEIDRSDLLPFFLAFCDLCKLTSMQPFPKIGDDASADTCPLPSPSSSMVPLLKTISRIREHIYTLAMMASGQSSLTHVCETVLHMWNLDVPVWASLDDYASSFAFHTSDMGVEMSLGPNPCEDINELLPSWCDRSQLHCDLQDELPAIAAPVAERPSNVPKVFAPNMISIYGLQHLTDNMNQDIHKGLTHWDAFYADLQNLEALLLRRQRRRRFVFTCLYGTPLAAHAWKFDHFSAGLYEKRWRCVISFLKKPGAYSM